MFIGLRRLLLLCASRAIMTMQRRDGRSLNFFAASQILFGLGSRRVLISACFFRTRPITGVIGTVSIFKDIPISIFTPLSQERIWAVGLKLTTVSREKSFRGHPSRSAVTFTCHKKQDRLSTLARHTRWISETTTNRLSSSGMAIDMTESTLRIWRKNDQLSSLRVIPIYGTNISTKGTSAKSR